MMKMFRAARAPVPVSALPVRRLLALAFLAVAALTAAFPVGQAIAQDGNYRIQPGDRLDITVVEDSNLNRTVLVGPDGRISLPLAGTVRAGGQTIEAVERNIAQSLAPNFNDTPNVYVALAALAAPDEQIDEEELLEIYILGEVNSPGGKQVTPGTTLLQAISLAGGPDRFAATKRIQLRRLDPGTGQERIFLFNYNAVERGAPIQSTLALRDGDVILVPERRLFE